MQRRDVLKNLTFSSGLLFLTPSIFSSCKKSDYQPLFFTQKAILLIDEIGETILPETENSLGAKAAQVGHFLDAYVFHCLPLVQQQVLQLGVHNFDKKCFEKRTASFFDLSQKEKESYLADLERAAESDAELSYFPILKELILFAYFTSKEGMETALRYVPVPGRYEGDYPFQEGDRAWGL